MWRLTCCVDMNISMLFVADLKSKEAVMDEVADLIDAVQWLEDDYDLPGDTGRIMVAIL